MKVVRIACPCGRNLADAGNAGGNVTGRPGVPAPEVHRAGGSRVIDCSYTWTCPDCGRTSSLHAVRIADAFRGATSDPRRVVPLVVGRDI